MLIPQSSCEVLEHILRERYKLEFVLLLLLLMFLWHLSIHNCMLQGFNFCDIKGLFVPGVLLAVLAPFPCSDDSVRKAAPTHSEWPPAGRVRGHTAANQREAEHGMWIFSFLGWCASITPMKWLFLPRLQCAKQYWRTTPLPASATEMYGCLLVCGKSVVHFLNESSAHSNGFIQFCITHRKSYTYSNPHANMWIGTF